VYFVRPWTGVWLYRDKKVVSVFVRFSCPSLCDSTVYGWCNGLTEMVHEGGKWFYILGPVSTTANLVYMIKKVGRNVGPKLPQVLSWVHWWPELFKSWFCCPPRSINFLANSLVLLRSSSAELPRHLHRWHSTRYLVSWIFLISSKASDIVFSRACLPFQKG
jgi:hypothetical protein